MWQNSLDPSNNEEEQMESEITHRPNLRDPSNQTQVIIIKDTRKVIRKRKPPQPSVNPGTPNRGNKNQGRGMRGRGGTIRNSQSPIYENGYQVPITYIQ